jgi:alcohol dehydrogenase
MGEIRKFVAPEFVFGSGAIDLLEQYLHHYGARKVLLVTDSGVSEAGWLSKVKALLTKAGIGASVFADISPNPRDFEVMNGARLYEQDGCDVIVAIGGGSVMDCAKGIGIVCSNLRHINAFEGVDNVDVPGPPLICIPTTAGTSADVSQFAIINNTEEQVKIAIISKAMVPDLALIDPATTLTMPPYLSLCTGIDALVHAVEAYVSTASSAITDVHAQEAIRLIHAYLPQVMAAPEDNGAREQVMLASLQAGLAFSNASLGAVHAMAHSLGGLLDLPHGECNGLLLEHVVAYNYPAASTRIDRIGRILGVDIDQFSSEQRCPAICAAIRQFREQLGMVGGLKDRGVGRDRIVELADKAMADPCMVTNPRRPQLAEIEGVYEAAL